MSIISVILFSDVLFFFDSLKGETSVCLLLLFFVVFLLLFFFFFFFFFFVEKQFECVFPGYLLFL